MIEDRTDEAVSARAEPPRTGVGAVDQALAAVAEAMTRPVDEQVPAVERAHEQLRRALDDTE